MVTRPKRCQVITYMLLSCIAACSAVTLYETREKVCKIVRGLISGMVAQV